MVTASGIRRRGVPALLLVAAAQVACDLPETTVPLGTPVVIVHAVMRPDLPPYFQGHQFVVVERGFRGDADPMVDSTTGDTTFTFGDEITIPYDGVPSLPLEGALVTVTNLDLPADPCGTTSFGPESGAVALHTRPGVYWGPPGCPTMRPGDRLALRVETTDGVVTGETVVPGMSGARLGVRETDVAFDSTVRTSVNRDHDTLRVDVDGSTGRLVQFESRRRTSFADPGTKIFIDTTSFTIPADLINTFELGNEDEVFRPGRNYVVTVAVTDRNYFDFARSANNKYTGRGFINRLEGGLGVFGSLVATTTQVHVTADRDDPREGVYHMQGVVEGDVSIDVTWELYLRRSLYETEFSAFVTGQWLEGALASSVDGRFVGDAFEAIVPDTVLGVARLDTVRGVWRTSASWPATLVKGCADPAAPSARCSRVLGTLTVDQSVAGGASASRPGS